MPEKIILPLLRSALERGKVVVTAINSVCPNALPNVDKDAVYSRIQASLEQRQLNKEALVELISTGMSDRSCARLLLKYSEVLSALDVCLRRQLDVVVSPLCIQKNGNEYCEFSSWIPPQDASSSLVVLWTSGLKAQAAEALALDYLGEHDAVGKMLGYPSCCVHSFRCGNFSSDISGMRWETAPIWRILGIPVLSHFPCKWTCVASQQAALLRLRYIEACVGASAYSWLPNGLLKFQFNYDTSTVTWTLNDLPIAACAWSTLFPFHEPPSKALAGTIEVPRSLVPIVFKTVFGTNSGTHADPKYDMSMKV